MKKILWYIEQLFPMIYYTTFTEGNIKYFMIWRMWFGKVFDKIQFEVKGE